MGPVREWVEATGSTVDIAVQAALQELGLESRDQAVVEIIKEGKPGILGSGWRAEDAVVKVMPKPPERKRRRRRGRGGGKDDGTTEGARGDSRASAGGGDRSGGSRDGRSGGRSEGGGQKGGGQQNAGRNDRGSRQPAEAPKDTREPIVTDASRRNSATRSDEPTRSEPKSDTPREQEASIEEQATIAADFVKGLLGAFGLEGEVTTTVDEDILKVEVTGDQTEALVGRKGAIMQSVLEITRTVVQRKTFGAPRMRIDINGYAERRREALTIYATRQAERLLEEGGEIMLEPMNAADRKVVHDAVAAIEGVRSFSEGEDPDRAVVISRDDES